MTKQINVHVWTITFEGDETWSTPIVGATREQAHDGTLAYLIDYLCEIYDAYDDDLINWRGFTSVDDLVTVANQEGGCFRRIEIEDEVHTLNASDLEYKEAEA